MVKSRALMALLSTGLLTLSAVTPAMASNLVGEAWGTVSWQAANWPQIFPDSPIGVSTFSVRDGRPGQASSRGDSGTYRLSRPDPNGGSLTIKVECVGIASGVAQFAGFVTAATGPYVLGEVFLVSVKDGRLPAGGGDEIGMKSYGFDLTAGCAAALSADQFGRKGSIFSGDITVRIR